MLECILHVGLWTIEYIKGGGSIIHVESIMEQLAKRKIHNSYFCGGRYNLLTPRTFIKKWRKPSATVYEVVNSPNLIGSYESIPFHITSDEIESLFLRILDEEKPDLIHFHELESLCGSLLSIARIKKIPYVVDIHNYWYLCHQGELTNMAGSVCSDFLKGKKCVNCYSQYRNSRLGWMYVGYVRNTPLGKLTEKLARVIYRQIARREKSLKKPSSFPPSLFYNRREFFVKELSKAPIVIFPSQRVKDIYSKYGVSPHRSFVIMALNTTFSHIKPKELPRQPKDKVVFGYVGRVVEAKGVHLILDAVEQLRDLDGLFVVSIFGGGDEVYIENLKKRAKNMKSVEFKGHYSQDEIQSVLDSIDIAIMPSIWEDCAPIVINELKFSRTPLIGSKIGGIAESVKHGVNGFLFEPSNVSELASYMRKIIENPSIISSFMESLDTTFDMDKYMQNIFEVYEEALTFRDRS